MMLHPDTPTLVGVAQWGLYFSILCPVFWASAYVYTRRQLVRALVVLLVCNGINSVVGVMQVYDPDRWMPRQLSSVYSAAGGDMILAVVDVHRSERPRHGQAARVSSMRPARWRARRWSPRFSVSCSVSSRLAR